MLRTFLVCLSSVFLMAAPADPRLEGASRKETGGWIQVRLEGDPATLGFQHGYLLAPEIDDALRMLPTFLKGSTGRDWPFFREAVQRLFWPKLGDEYRTEIEGIAKGLKARGYQYDALDLVVLNGWLELSWYYLPSLAEQAKPGSADNKAPGNCSAFIATGSATRDGRIVMGHNAWVDYPIGSRWRIAFDLHPSKGQRLAMDGFPGSIQSGDDFAINGAGILITETTISGFKGFAEGRTPEFVRARRAAQYARSIEDFVSLISEDNNGAYANTWLVGDLKTNEIAKLDLGLKHQKLWRAKDGAFVGSNFATDEMLLKDETTFDAKAPTSSPNARKARWDGLMAQNRGRIDADLGKAVLADHRDSSQGKEALNRCGLCGHVDRDPQGAPEWSNDPFYPIGAINAKVTTADLARAFTFWGRMGHPCGEPFRAGAFMAAHPQYRWMAAVLQDMEPQPWCLLGPLGK
ncbi:hypothetical protein GETHLI_06340 [Geothrix limicola]|uniref:Peptidase C45 n=1 Tax=Geothrix limicola TaxID=2927978 RepID=A0ABQ5QBQ0_9BACT|nr:C45 family autoproteolytic acyltransferase/hydolase [Geothrix limicola]GLH72132.1 hypothetical protein GETHLI_06340 [Geothrix limicola]